MKKHQKASAIPYYGTALVCLIYAAILPTYRLWHFFFLAAAATAAFFLLKKVFPAKVYYTAQPQPEPNTGNVELDAAIRQGRDGLERIRQVNLALEDPYITRQLEQLETITDRIFRQVTAHPELLPQIRRFMNYYFPTTVKLLESYRELDASGAAGTDVETSKQKIVGMLDTVVAAFQNQLNALFSAKTMDINAEVQVLETMMQAEGIGGTPNQNRHF